MLGLKCYRSGIRRNNSLYALSGRQKVAPLMFIGNHGIYRSLLLNDMRVRVTAPEEIRKFMSANESFSRSGDHFRGEGGDYITETENKHLKSHLPLRDPTIKRWRSASRNHKPLTENRKVVFERSGMIHLTKKVPFSNLL